MKKPILPPDRIEIRGAHVHNLKGVDVDIPLHKLVGIAGVSGSGKSSLALGVLYSEGSRRYLEALSTYTRRRISQEGRSDVDLVRNVPSAIALHQRPNVPGIRSTFGTMSELNNILRLIYSRLGSHRCPNGHLCPPSRDVALMKATVCPTCGASFYGPGAEELSFNSSGACPSCGGTGFKLTVDRANLVPDENLTLEEGAVAPWNSLMWTLMVDVARAMGVRTNVPFKDLTPEEKAIVYDGPMEKKHILYRSKKTDDFAELDFTYYSAVNTVLNALSKAKDEKGMKRVSRFLKEEPCPDCHGTRLSDKARSSLVRGLSLDQAGEMPLSELMPWVEGIPATMPGDMLEMANGLAKEFTRMAKRLVDLGLDYLSLSRSGSTLSTGERQRVELARAVRSETTGVLYVLDEPSIGLHPHNVDGLLGVFDDLLSQGNSIVMVDHDERILSHSDHLIELGPKAGAEGGRIISQGTVEEVSKDPNSLIGPFLSGQEKVRVRPKIEAGRLFEHGSIHLKTSEIHTVHPLDVSIPRGRLVAVTGVSGSGKTTMVLESLVPGLQAKIAGQPLPSHVKELEAEGIRRVNLIDATPIGANVRSTVATYSGVLDDLRGAYARTPAAKAAGLKAGDFSYNSGSLRCSECDGTGTITLDVQFLPDMDIACPSCHGSRYKEEAKKIKWPDEEGLSIVEMMSLTVDEALERTKTLKKCHAKLEVLSQLGLGYLTLGEATPSLSGGEAQRLKLAFEMGKVQSDALFVFDEPTIGLHPLDVRLLLSVFDRLIAMGASVLVIEHDLDFIANSDYVIDLGPGGGINGGRLVYQGATEGLMDCPESLTGPYLKGLLN